MRVASSRPGPVSTRRSGRGWGSRLVGLGAFVLPLACSVASLEDASLSTPKNHCQSNDDCAQGHCDAAQRVCVAESGQFATVLFEVTTPATSSEFSGIRFIRTLEGVSSTGGMLDLDLDVVSTVTGSVSPTRGAHQSDCELSYEGSTKVPVKITLTPSERLLGLSTQVYAAETQKVGGDEFGFSLKLPAGVYDLYVEPSTEVGGEGPLPCTVVPQLVREVKIAAGSVELPLVAQAPSVLKLKVQWPTPDLTDPLKNALTTLEGWTVDVIDPATGRLLSATAVLSQTSTAGGYELYEGIVEYAPVLGSPATLGKELVRLRPPSDVTAPTIVLERGTLDAFGVGEALINHLGGVPQPISIVDSPVQSADGKLVAGNTTIKFVAREFGFLDPGTVFAFERTVESSDGKFSVDLLPGQYEVYVSPPAGSGLATTRTTMEIAKQPLTQTGKTLTVAAVSKVSGTVFSPMGSPLVGASIYAVASPVLIDPLLLAAGTQPIKPLAMDAVVEPDGRFVVQADPGTFDFTVRADDRAGYAWLVRPNVTVQTAAHDLSALTLSLPVAFQGSVSVPGVEAGEAVRVPVPGALVRAFVYLNEDGYTSDPKAAKSVLQVAETRAHADGSFDLLLPSRLN